MGHRERENDLVAADQGRSFTVLLVDHINGCLPMTDARAPRKVADLANFFVQRGLFDVQATIRGKYAFR